MADHLGIEAVGLSLVRLLNLCFSEHPPITAGSRTKAVLMRTEEMDPANRPNDMTPPMVSLFLYRVDVNRHTRPAWSSVAHQDGQVHLPLDLFYLLTPWASNAEFEYRILGQAMTCLERTPILDGPLLHPTAGWQGNESIQLSILEISNEDLMRTFDSLPVNYKLSIPYVARIARLDGRQRPADTPVHHAVFGAAATSES